MDEFQGYDRFITKITHQKYIWLYLNGNLRFFLFGIFTALVYVVTLLDIYASFTCLFLEYQKFIFWSYLLHCLSRLLLYWYTLVNLNLSLISLFSAGIPPEVKANSMYHVFIFDLTNSKAFLVVCSFVCSLPFSLVTSVSCRHCSALIYTADMQRS